MLTMWHSLPGSLLPWPSKSLPTAERTLLNDGSRDVAAFSLQLFGRSLAVFAHGRNSEPTPLSLTIRTRKGLWLLALLALNAGKEVPREWLGAALWPDSEVPRDTLRRTLTDLRSGIGDLASAIESTHTWISLRIPPSSVDVLQFDVLIKQGTQAALQQAVDLHRGPLLEDCQDSWVLLDRTRRAHNYSAALETLSAAHIQSNDYPAAIRCLRLAIASDPSQERLYRRLMTALAATGETTAAILLYRELRRNMVRDVGLEVSPETIALYREIRSSAGNAADASLSLRGLASESAEDAPSANPTNLPSPLTTLLGRADGIERVKQAFGSSRLITLQGVGGIGKTRLAIEAANQLRPQFPGGVWFVDLTVIADPTLLPAAVAAAAEVREEGGEDITKSLTSALQSKTALIVMDNCEHLIEGCAAFVRGLIRQCSMVSVLATSRQSLRLTGETVIPIEPLSVPDRVALAQDEDIDSIVQSSAALRLFVERASAIQSEFKPSRENIASLAEICRRLEGIPLSLELAAARVSALSVQQIAGLLKQRLRLLTGGDRAAQPRQQSLRALIDWSYDLLGPDEQLLFAQLSIFLGGWTLEAATAVSGADGEDGQWETLDRIDALVEQSMILVEQKPDGVAHYRMLETLREYAGEKLTVLGEREAAQDRYIDWYVHCAEEAEKEKGTANQATTLNGIEQDHDNYRQALQLAGPEIRALKIAASLYWFWYIHGHYTEGRTWLERVTADNPDAPAQLLGRAIRGAGDLCWAQGNMEDARRLHLYNLPLLRAAGDHRGEMVTLNSLGLVAFHQGDCVSAYEYYRQGVEIARSRNDSRVLAPILSNIAIALKDLGRIPEAIEALREAEAINREIGDRRGLGLVIHTLCLLATRQGDYQTAYRYVEESINADREMGDEQGVAVGIHTRGDIALLEGDLNAAQDSYVEALATFERLGSRRSIAAALCALGNVSYAKGQENAARDYFHRSLVIEIALDNRHGMADCLRGFAHVEHAAGRSAMAAQLLAVVRHEMERLGGTPSPQAQAEFEKLSGDVRAALGEEAFQAEWEAAGEKDFCGVAVDAISHQI